MKNLKLLGLITVLISTACSTANARDIMTEQDLILLEKKKNCTENCDYEDDKLLNRERPNLKFVRITCDTSNKEYRLETYTINAAEKNYLESDYPQVYELIKKGNMIELNGSISNATALDNECPLTDTLKIHSQINYANPINYKKGVNTNEHEYKLVSSPVQLDLKEGDKSLFKSLPTYSKPYEIYSLSLKNENEFKFCFSDLRFCKDFKINELSKKPLDGTPKRTVKY